MTLRVTLEVVPFGVEEKKYEIGRLDIFNKGCDATGDCEYGVMDLSPKRHGLFTQSVIHTRNQGAWQLLKKALKYLEIEGP